MTNQSAQQSQQFIQQAYQALRSGDKLQASLLARQAADLNPLSEDAWLILAAAAPAPQQSIECLKQALQINPSSQRARKGMQWAVQRLRAEPAQPPQQSIEDTAPRKVVQPDPISPAETFQLPLTSPTLTVAQPAVAKPRPPKVAKPTRRNTLMRVLISIIFLASLAVLVWAGYPVILQAFAQNPSSARPESILFKPSLTNTPTPTPTSTPTPTPTNTPTPTSTPTFTPTDTPTAVPTDTPIPPPTYTPLANNPENVVIPAEIGEETAWIDVDLSEQMLYAYQGQRLMNSFLISSGTSAHPTVVGQFHIYVKYRYADMSGPGYYLPDVPYVMYFYDGYGLHGTYWHSNFGTPMSHGCVNLETGNAGWLFDFASVGTMVNIHP